MADRKPSQIHDLEELGGVVMDPRLSTALESLAPEDLERLMAWIREVIEELSDWEEDW